MLNLLSNSFKFTKKGKIVIRCESVENCDLIKISVIDSGVGMDMETKIHVYKLMENINGQIYLE